MTREQARKLLPIIEAYANGAEVEFRMGDGAWYTLVWDSLFSPRMDYRIKPERDRNKDLGQHVRHKNSGSVAIITRVGIDDYLIGMSIYPFDEFDNAWEFIDA